MSAELLLLLFSRKLIFVNVAGGESVKGARRLIVGAPWAMKGDRFWILY
jgi:hypothetical protein